MIVAFTGHRPNKLGGYTYPNATSLRICKSIREELEKLKPTWAISGMAQGVDQWAAEICISLQISFTAAIPFLGQEKLWPSKAQAHYNWLLSHAKGVSVICTGEYSPKKMQKRNEWMVDNTDVLLAVWDGTSGGTANCVRYAEKKKKQIVRINPYP